MLDTRYIYINIRNTRVLMLCTAHRVLLTHYNRVHTPSERKQVVPLVRNIAKHSDDQCVQHDSLCQHPAEHTQEQVVQYNCHCSTQPLHVGRKHEVYILCRYAVNSIMPTLWVCCVGFMLLSNYYVISQLTYVLPRMAW